MLVRCVLMSGCGRVRQSCDICLRTVCAVTDHLAVHAHGRLVRMQLVCSLVAWLNPLTHLEKRHLVLSVHLVAKNAVRSKIVWLMQV